MLYFPTNLLAFPSILLDWPRYEVGCSCLPALIWKHFGHLAGDVPNPPLESGLWPTLCCRAPRSQLSPLRPYLAVTSLTQHPMADVFTGTRVHSCSPSLSPGGWHKAPSQFIFHRCSAHTPPVQPLPVSSFLSVRSTYGNFTVMKIRSDQPCLSGKQRAAEMV